MKYKLYLASASLGRQQLLEDAKINFKIVTHSFDEEAFEASFKTVKKMREIVAYLALEKSNSINLSTLTDLKNNEIFFTLSADTLAQNSKGEILSKPKSKEEAIYMITSAREKMACETAFCIKKYCKEGDKFILLDEFLGFGVASYKINVPNEFIEYVLSNVNYLKLSGGMTISGFGQQFCEYLDGSFSAVLGLPMFELRIALKNLGFYDK